MTNQESEKIRKSFTDGGWVNADHGKYEPRNFKVGDNIVCIKAHRNNHVNEEIIVGKEYIVGYYSIGSFYAKGLVQLEGGRVNWFDDHFELIIKPEPIDIGYIYDQKKIK